MVGGRARAGRRTNLALLGGLALALLTGVVGYQVGTPAAARWVTVLHGVLGLALLVLVPWKDVVVRRGLARRRPRPGRWSGLVLGVLVVLCLAGGVAHASFGDGTYLGVTALQVHVGAALLAIPFLAHHAVVRRQRVRPADLSRRSLVGVAGLVAAAAGLYLASEGAAALLRLPGHGRGPTGSYEEGSDDPDAMPVTQWIADPVPVIGPAGWSLLVAGPAGTRRVPYADLAGGTDRVRAVLDCTGGWYAAQTWRGVRLDRLVPGLRPGQSVDVVSATGYRRRLPGADAGRLLLATHAGAAPLSAGHGAPVRLVAPGRRGFCWVKWVVRVEVVDEPWWWQPPFPTQ